MKKIIVVSLLFFISTVGLAHPVVNLLTSQSEQTLIGEGIWRSQKGVKDTWTAKLTIRKWDGVLNDETGMKLTWETSIRQGETIIPVQNTLHFAVDRDLFIKIFDHTGLKPIGLGYCEEDFCHLSAEAPDGTKMEESWITKDGLKSIFMNGSHIYPGTNSIGTIFRGTYKE